MGKSKHQPLSDEIKSDLVDGIHVALFGTEREKRGLRARAYPENEKSRVRALVQQMGIQEAEERRRSNARFAYENGDDGAYAELIIEPTPELLVKGKFDKITVENEHHQNVRTYTTLRRRAVPMVYDLHCSGLIDANQLTVCRWYRDCWEATGLTGNIPSTDYGKEVFSPVNNRSMFTEWQVESQDIFRQARASITTKWLPFFDGVVLQDFGLRKAMKLSRGDNRKARGRFKECVEELQTEYENQKRR